MTLAPHAFANRPARARIALVFSLAGASIAGVATWALASAPPSGAKAAPSSATRSADGALTADLAVAQRQAFDITTVANGDLQAKNQVELRNKLDQAATIQFIIEEGKRVAKGELLCQLNDEAIQRQIDEMTPRLASAKAELVAAVNSYEIQVNDNASALRKAELQLDLAGLALKQWREGDAVKRRQQLRLAAETAELELDRLAQKFVRSQELLAEGFLSKDECDRDEIAYINAISAYQTTNLELDVYDTFEYAKDEKQKLSDVEEAQAEVRRVRLNNEIQLASKDADRANRREQVTLLESQLKKLAEQKDACKIIAPQEGLVVYSSSVDNFRWGGQNEGPLQIGQQVWPNQLIIALPDTSEMVASVRVHESLAGRIKPGQDVEVKIDAAGGRIFAGKVESVGVMAESGGWRDPNLREYRVRVTLEADKEVGLKPAMRVEGRIILDRVPETLTVPIQSVFSDGAVQFVYAPTGSRNRFERIPVRLGRRSDALAEVAAGVGEGQRVLLRSPAPNEVLVEPWDHEQLKLAGYLVNEKGEISLPRGGPGGPGGRRAARGPNAPEGAAKPEAPADAKSTEGKPAESAEPAKDATTTASSSAPVSPTK
jgi:multidrug resistance efflux pump